MISTIVSLVHLVAAPTAADSVYRGMRGETTVPVPRAEVPVEVDGVLDESAWRGAAVLTGFSQYSPVDGVPAADSTEVLVWYSSQAIHFGIRAYEPHGEVTARLADRDRIDDEDHVQILLDTFNDGRRAYVIGANAFGVQSDGIRIEGVGVDLSPDFIFDSHGRLTEYGFEVEIRVPLQSLKYQDAEEQTWGLNVIRNVQHSGHTQTWTAARRAQASFLAQSGTLTGIAGLEPGLALDVNPVATARMDGAPVGPDWAYGGPSTEVGANVRWGLTSNLVLNGTINPDFSQVEADAGQISYDPRQALYFPEKRPFFTEGSEQFETPNRLIYTRSISAPEGAVKLTGNVSEFSVGVLTAVDDASLRGSGTDRPIVNIVRLQRNLGSASTVGLVYTDRRVGTDFNSVAGADARLVFGGIYTFSLQGAASVTRTAGESVAAPLWDVGFQRAGRRLGLDARIKGIDEEFVTRSGFLQRTGIAQARLAPTLYFYGDPGARVESWTLGMRFIGDWRHDALLAGKSPDDTWKVHLVSDVSLAGGWRLGASIFWERFFYARELYKDYVVERATPAGTDTVPFVGQPGLPNYDLALRLTTPNFSNFSGNGSVILGQDDNFDEWASAYIFFMDASIHWRPTGQVRVDATYARQQRIRTDSWATQSNSEIARLKVEYQLTRSIFLRFVGEYDARYRDALRDDTRTNDPILVLNRETGVYERTTEVTSNGFRADWLFSLRPSPGTLVFVGYGSSMTEPEAFRFRDLRRTSDSFFVKLSYLFRM